MIQRTGDIHNEAELLGMVSSIRDIKTYDTARTVFVQLYLSRFTREEAQKVIDFVRKELPKAKVAGMTIFGNPDVHLNTGKFIRFNTSIFDSSDVSVFEYDCTGTEAAEAAAKVKERIAAIEDARGVLLFASSFTFHISHFMEEVTRGLEDIPFFGALADMNTEDGEAFLPCVFGSRTVSVGVVAVVFSGRTLEFYTESLFNWNPIGKPLKVEAGEPGTIGDTLLTRIDGLPAIQIYKKYLNVDPDSHFTMNICEFPIAVERNGCIMARVPCGFTENGELNLMGDIKDGEEIRFTYGKTDDILLKTRQESERMAAFQPEAIFLFVCANRVLFMRKRAAEEISYYSTIVPGTSYCHGGSELLRFQGKGGVLNSHIVTVGLREQERRKSDSPNRSTGISFDMLNSAKESGMSQEASVAPNDSGKIIPLADRLITFLEATTDDLKKAEQAAKAANEAKSNFLSSMSHEIRTPINAVLGLDEMILRESNENAIKGYARDIQSSGRSLLAIINDILDFSKIEAGKLEIINADYDLRSVISDVTNMTAIRTRQKGLGFIVDVDVNMPHLLHGDETRIKQCVVNILTNAAKYTHEGSVTFKVGYEKKDDSHILLSFSVSDTGIGIKEEDLPKLFKPFERVEEKRNRNIEGTGLGMSIVTGLLSQMGSKLDVKSVYGEGSTFSFAVEQKVRAWERIGTYEEAQEALSKEATSYSESFQAPDARILIIDDIPMNLTVMQGLLKKTRIQMDTALSAEEGLELARRNTYHILFVDHLMPKMDGLEFLAAVRSDQTSLNRDTPAIALTANAVSGAKEMYLAAGFNGYLSKPVDPKKLEHTARGILPKKLVILPGDNGFVRNVKSGWDGVERRVSTGVANKLFVELFDLDIDAAMKNCGSKDVFLQAAKSFYEWIDEKSCQIEQYAADKDWKNYKIQVHALKSSARLIGAMELSEMARLLEELSSREVERDVLDGTPLLLERYRSYKTRLSALSNVK